MAVLPPDLTPDPQVVDTLHHLGVARADDLLPLLHSPNEAIAQQACWALGYVGTKTHSRALLSVLTGNRPALWMPSAVSLSLLESKRPTRGLLQLTLDATRPAEQRYAAAYALAFSSAALSDPRYSEAIAGAFMTVLRNQQEPPHLRGLVAEGLGNMVGGCFGGHCRPRQDYPAVGQLLMAALRDPEPEVRFWAAFALGALRYRAALPALRELAGTDESRFGNWWTVGEEASDAIDRIEGREPLERSMRSE